MFNSIEDFLVRGHQKVIDHYVRLLRSSVAGAERARIEARLAEEEDALRHLVESALSSGKRAA